MTLFNDESTTLEEVSIDYDKKSFYYKGAILLRKYLTFFSKLKNIIRGK